MAYPTDNTALAVYAGTALMGDVDHAGWHGLTNADVDGLKNVCGTTAGTSVLKNVLVGQFVATTAGTETLTNKTLTDPVIANLVGNDGWIKATDTWTYASATTFTISGVDRTAMFPKGTKIKLTQTTAKYFYVVGSAFSTNTTITVTGGSDYSLANATITSPLYSYQTTPQGFPSVFAYSPTVTSGSGAITSYTTTAVFSLVGKMAFVTVLLSLTNAGTAATDIRITLPITAVGVGGYATGSGFPTNDYRSLGVGGLSTGSFLFRNYDGNYIGASGTNYVVSYTYNI